MAETIIVEVLWLKL